MNLFDFDLDNPVAKMLSGAGHGGPAVVDVGRGYKALVMTIPMTDGFQAVVAADSYFPDGASRAEVVNDLTRGGAALSQGLKQVAIHDTISNEVFDAKPDFAKLLGVPFPVCYDLKSRKLEDAFREALAGHIADRLGDGQWVASFKEGHGFPDYLLDQLDASLVNACSEGRDPRGVIDATTQVNIDGAAQKCDELCCGIDDHLAAARGGETGQRCVEAALERGLAEGNSALDSMLSYAMTLRTDGARLIDKAAGRTDEVPSIRAAGAVRRAVEDALSAGAVKSGRSKLRVTLERFGVTRTIKVEANNVTRLSKVDGHDPEAPCSAEDLAWDLTNAERADFMKAFGLADSSGSPYHTELRFDNIAAIEYGRTRLYERPAELEPREETIAVTVLEPERPDDADCKRYAQTDCFEARIESDAPRATVLAQVRDAAFRNGCEIGRGTVLDAGARGACAAGTWQNKEVPIGDLEVAEAGIEDACAAASGVVEARGGEPAHEGRDSGAR